MELKYGYLLLGNKEKIGNCNLYSASIQRLHSTQRDEIVLAKAKHLSGCNKNHVNAVVITNSKILLMPRIGTHYINLVALYITDCALHEISKEDLEPFQSLRWLILSNNLIESLPADLFVKTNFIEQLSFQSNKIRFISQLTLTPLTFLKIADFRDNVTIDDFYDFDESASGSIALSMLKRKIVLQCAPSNEQISTVSSYVHNLWQGDFSDFKIKAREEVFNVHKAVMAINSTVFAAMFSHKMEENVKNEVTIVDVCPETIKEFLEFVYLRQIPKKCYNATELYAMAEKYQVKELSAHIQWHIVDEVTVENAAEIFKKGVLYNNEVIKQAAFEGIEKSLNKKLPVNLIKSVDDMMELLEAKDKLDEVIKRAIFKHK